MTTTPDTEPTKSATCRHCTRTIVNEGGAWIDPEAPVTGDDSVWRETCDAHDTFTAEHEPVEPVILMVGNPSDGFKLIGPVMPNDPDLDRFIELYMQNDYWWYVPLMSLREATEAARR